MTISLAVLGGFSVRVDDAPVEVAPAGQRVLALTALLGGTAPRSRLAGLLWPERLEGRALANLRGALWRLPPAVRDHVDARGAAISLPSRWLVDLDEVTETARRLRRRDGEELVVVDRRLLARDLLPDWDDDWLVVRRELHRQLRLHALEDLAEAEILDDRPLDALDTAMQAIAAEPLRESAQLLVLRAHLAAGNRAEVLRHFERFRILLHDEMGLDPSAAMREVVAQVADPRRDGAVTGGPERSDRGQAPNPGRHDHGADLA